MVGVSGTQSPIWNSGAGFGTTRPRIAPANFRTPPLTDGSTEVQTAFPSIGTAEKLVEGCCEMRLEEGRRIIVKQVLECGNPVATDYKLV